MLVQIGPRNSTGDVVDLLRECHARIRRFLELATRLAATPSVAAGEVRTVTEQIRRYFVEAFPLHLADEDESILPTLSGRAPSVDAALATMHADHVDHAGLVERLIELCAQLHDEPEALPAQAAGLATATEALRAVLEPHLMLEEREIFPAIARLAAADRDAIKTAMRQRRETPAGAFRPFRSPRAATR